MRGKPTHSKALSIGDIVEIAQSDNGVTTWHEATVVSTSPMQAEDEYSNYNLNSILWRRTNKKSSEPVKRELNPDVELELYKKALVQIIREGDTARPNSTVKRIVNLAKEALGEITI